MKQKILYCTAFIAAILMPHIANAYTWTIMNNYVAPVEVKINIAAGKDWHVTIFPKNKYSIEDGEFSITDGLPLRIGVGGMCTRKIEVKDALTKKWLQNGSPDDDNVKGTGCWGGSVEITENGYVHVE